MKSTDTQQFLADLNAGVFSNQIGRAISEVADGVSNFGGKGKVVITLDLARIGESQQVNIKHSLKYLAPTKNGDRSEKTANQTPMYVNAGGEVTAFPKDQRQLFEDRS